MRGMKIVKLLTDILLAGCSTMGIRHSEEPHYQLLADHGDIQVRSYPPLLLAETVIHEADYGRAGGIGFNRLARYIFGGNVSRQQMPMTTPVLREPAGEQIAMTAPVLQQTSNAGWVMSFVMPAGYELASLPAPLDQEVTLRAIPARKVAVLRYAGKLTAERIVAKSQALQGWLMQHQYQIVSAPRSAAYDPPWTLPALRRNEIHIDIE